MELFLIISVAANIYFSVADSDYGRDIVKGSVIKMKDGSKYKCEEIENNLFLDRPSHLVQLLESK
jgi:preprotein translocase subunit SecF